MSVKLVAIDMDGTLLNEQGVLSPAVVESVKKARQTGAYIVICTGRPLSGALEQLADLDLLSTDDYVISYNGSLVLNTNTWDVVLQHGLTRDDYLYFDMLSRKIGVHLHTVSRDAIYTSNRDISRYSVNEAHMVNLPLKYRTPEEIADEVTPVKLMMIDEPEILRAAIKKIPKHLFEEYTLVTSSPYYLEILNKEASKGSAVKELAAHLGIAREEVMAIGDAENDLSMLEFAGISVAMGNATPEVKATAKYEVASNQEDGVKEALDRWVLQ